MMLRKVAVARGMLTVLAVAVTIATGIGMVLEIGIRMAYVWTVAIGMMGNCSWMAQEISLPRFVHAEDHRINLFRPTAWCRCSHRLAVACRSGSAQKDVIDSDAW